ncbi:putative dTDP-4-dehydrorhamnose reductase [Candidatus Syntrophocurvum alkaliphilum]|uniref:dTDP-4-dehydrorhamnose reductase n=1 Tax=Candidatus Syntrophocurvum alkaliphilum TaxID=2293317 RepID=A0A6I6DM38_9FIRM|nr:SDR family oxidoreductase [Candidatus Syntrophocurvum alkaliphilum]QGU00162.1 putative dTDP-4-dehydrorhamnose reductase [Candidatus Syntrophocurvum alkaliphilum]
MKILVLGATGMLGHKLFMHLSSYKDFSVFATARDPNILHKNIPTKMQKNIIQNMDAKNVYSITNVIKYFKPNIVINCIGIIKQGSLGSNNIANIEINALLPHKIATVCNGIGARLIHFSTDCVFSGKKGNYVETDEPDAKDLYGKTKMLGEVDYPHCLTLRTSIIGHELQSKLGLIEWFLSQEDIINGYTNHIYTGFPTIELANIIAKYIIPHEELHGIYHLSTNPISKYELLKLVADIYKKKITVKPYDATSCDRSLISNRLQKIVGYSPPSWRDLVEKMYQDYLVSSYSNY